MLSLHLATYYGVQSGSDCSPGLCKRASTSSRCAFDNSTQRCICEFPDQIKLLIFYWIFFKIWWRQLAEGRSLKYAWGSWGERYRPRNATAIHSVAVDRTPNLPNEKRTVYHWAIATNLLLQQKPEMMHKGSLVAISRAVHQIDREFAKRLQE